MTKINAKTRAMCKARSIEIEPDDTEKTLRDLIAMHDLQLKIYVFQAASQKRDTTFLDIACWAEQIREMARAAY